MGEKVNHIESAYKNLYEWYEHINNKEVATDEGVEKYSEKFYPTVEEFCKEYNLKNVAYAIVNKHRNSVDLIQKDLVAEYKLKLPFIKYPKSEDTQAIIDLFFGNKRGNEKISDTEYFRYIINNPDKDYIYANYQKILNDVIIWRIYLKIINRLEIEFPSDSEEYSFQELISKIKNKHIEVDEVEWEKLKEKHNSFFENLSNENKEFIKSDKFNAEFLKDYFNFEILEVKPDICEENIKKLSSSLSELHKKSPIPIIPYYVELLLNNFAHINHIVIPISYSGQYKYKIQDKSLQSISALLVATGSGDKNDIQEDVRRDIQRFFSIVGNPILDQYFYGNVIKSVLLSESIKSAKSAIMARNLSHNLGSHVMAYLKQYLKAVQDIVQQRTLIDLITAEDWEKKLEEIKDKKICNDSELPFLVGLGRFISYLQERQDFIATICTDYIPYYSTVNFKDFIYDEINPDCRSHRHPDVKGIKTDNILLKFIAQSEGLTREIKGDQFADNNIVIKFKGFNGLAKQNDDDLEDMRKYEFSLPGGIVGRQAFFSIVENIIRNAAKHGNRGNNKNLELTIEIFDKNTLPQNLTQYANYEEIQNDDLYIITITDNTTDNDGVVEKLTKTDGGLYESYVNEQGKLEENNKGIKEMRISACYLRGIAVIDEAEYQKNANNNSDNNKNNKTPIFNVFATANNNLQYVFCIPKPKKIAFVLDSTTKDIIDECNKNLQPKHCKIFTAKDFNQESRKNYEFIVAQAESVYTEILPYSHSRIVTVDFSEKMKNKFCDFDVEDYMCERYQQLKTVESIKEIYIRDDDGKGGSLLKPEDDKYKRSTKIKVVNDDELKGCDKSEEIYCYRKHHDTKENFDIFMNFNIKKVEFIESVTGSNSTDRLIRKDELTDLWFYRQANAMATKVAIFDERLFTKITGIQQSDIVKESVGNTWWEDILKLGLDAAKQQLIDNDKVRTIQKDDIEAIDDMNELKSKCNEYFCTRKPLESKTHQPLVFRQKNIDFFTWCYDSNADCYVLWGFSKEIKGENKYKAEYKVIGTIKIKDKKLNIELESKITEKYDFITVHQGLLDKIYKKVEGKNDLTDKIFEEFSKNKKVNDFLPKFIIHSGRSKPSEQDMPQQQPFIQYSALENAVSDCKYSLVELLEHSHYERTNNS